MRLIDAKEMERQTKEAFKENPLREKPIGLMVEAKKADPEDAPFSEFLADFMIDNGVENAEFVWSGVDEVSIFDSLDALPQSPKGD